MQVTDIWVGFEGVMNDHPFLIKARESMVDFNTSKEYNHRVDILWRYESAETALMPPEHLMDEMEKAEHSLIAFLENDLQAVLSFVYLGNNQKVWYWYSKDIEETAKRINGALEHFGKLPVELFAHEDPYWEQYKNVMKDMESK